MGEPKTENMKGDLNMLETLASLYPDWTFRAGNPDELKPVVLEDPLRCIEDRIAAEGVNLAPALPGGVGGVASALAKIEGASAVTELHAHQAISLLDHAGIRPGGHDLDPLHCGRVGLALSGKLPEELPWELSPEQLKAQIEAANGEVQHMLGEHTGNVLGLNFVPDTTRPADTTQFQADAWVGNLLHIDPMLFVDDAIRTVAALGKPKDAVIWE